MSVEYASNVIAIPGFSEPFSSLTHLLGAAVFLVFGVLLIGRHGKGVAQAASLLVFVFGVTFALSMSGVFHLLTPGTVGKQVLQVLDHAAIFFLIAATYTPIHVIIFRGFMRWGVLTLVWVFAISGITLKSIFFNDIPEWLGLSLYLGLGWFGVFSTYQLYRRFGFDYIKFIIYGALAYTVGATMEFLRLPIIIPNVLGPHEMFHFMVLIGISMHWIFIQKVAREAPGFAGEFVQRSGIAPMSFESGKY
ncbi:PAQR family membrane homeostasis protein TrhA [Kaarinaea lacus]